MLMAPFFKKIKDIRGFIRLLDATEFIPPYESLLKKWDDMCIELCVSPDFNVKDDMRDEEDLVKY